MDSPEDTLVLMDSFNYIKPLKVKSGQMVWLCTCADAYQSYCCVESVILSLRFNPVLEVPDIARLKQIKERERAAHANPFNAATFDIEKKKERDRKKAEKLEPNWKPAMASFSATHQFSAAAMALQGGRPKAAGTADAPEAGAAPADAAQPAVLTEPESVPVIEAQPTSAVEPVSEPVSDPKKPKNLKYFLNFCF